MLFPSYTRSSPSKTSVFIHIRTSSSAHAHIPILATPPGPPFVRLHRNFLQFKPTLLPNNRYFLQLLFVVSLKLCIPALLRSPLLLIIIKVRLIPSILAICSKLFPLAMPTSPNQHLRYTHPAC